MSEKKEEKRAEITEIDVFDRRDFVKKAGRWSAFVAATFIGGSATIASSGCLYTDYSDGGYVDYYYSDGYYYSNYGYSAYSNYSYSAYSAYSNYSNY